MLRNNIYGKCDLRLSHHLHKQAFSGLSRQGFSLLEVLVAMTILMILVIMVANMFSQATNATNIGNERAEVETAGRAALGFMSMKLSQAIVGTDYWRFKLSAGDDVSFCSASDTVLSNRFYFDGSNLVYSYGTNSGVLIENVENVKFYAYKTHDALSSASENMLFNYSDATNLPYCFDIGIRLLSASDNKRKLSGGSDFIARNGRWFTTRVYFQLRQGYMKHDYRTWDRDPYEL